MSVPVVFAIAGVIAFFLGIWGGEIKVKEIEIPHATTKVRVVVGSVGLILILASIRMSLPVSSGNIPQFQTESPTATTLIPNTATAVNTETPLPSPTITTVPTLTVEEQSMELLNDATHSWNLKVLETFDENNYKWDVGEKKTGDELDVANITINGKYHIDIKTRDGGGWWLLSSIITPEKFYLATDARRTTTQPGCLMSLAWSTTNGNYLFEINDDDQYYKLEVYDREISENNGWRDVVPRTTSNLIRSQEINRMAVIDDGTYIWLYLNDQFLERVENEYKSDGDLGYYLSVCQDDVQVTFEFDNLELRTPD